MQPYQLEDIFLASLVRETGRDRRHWRGVLGDLRVYPVATHPHCNWAYTPTGSTADVARVERLADNLRLRHPIVSGGA